MLVSDSKELDSLKYSLRYNLKLNQCPMPLAILSVMIKKRSQMQALIHEQTTVYS